MALVPGPEVNAALGFAITRAATMYGITVHVVAALSNHVHVELTDPRGKLSDFMALFKSLVTRSLNSAREGCEGPKWEYFWAPTRKSAMLVTTYEDGVARLAYVLANPVSAGLVRSCEEWPGLSTKPADLRAIAKGGLTLSFDKPDFFYRKEKDGGKIPDRLFLKLAPHPLGARDPEKFAEDVIAATEKLVVEARREAARKKRRFKGAEAVMQTKRDSVPRTPAKQGQLIPTFCAKDKARRLALIAGHRDWLKAYHAALTTWRKRGRAVVPAGTNAMRGMPGVTVRDGPVLWMRA
jgi:REP element-mobilizing transposase RayT